MQVRAGFVHFTTPENGGVDIDVTHLKVGKAEVFTGKLWAFPFILRIKPGQCSDGMSDTVYDLTASLTILERTENGCARLK